MISPPKWPVMQTFDVFFDGSLNQLVNKQSSCQGFWDAMLFMCHHCNVFFALFSSRWQRRLLGYLLFPRSIWHQRGRKLSSSKTSCHRYHNATWKTLCNVTWSPVSVLQLFHGFIFILRLQYLQYVSNGDTAVLHEIISIISRCKL